jgi:lipoprotein-anchoring transpeptidase ErfK/SrfK
MLDVKTQSMNPSLLRLLSLCLVSAALTGCSTVNDMVTSHMPSFHEGRASVLVRLNHQQAILRRGGNEMAAAHVSTGREGYRTPTGRFHVIRKDPDHRSSLYGDYVNASGAVVKPNVDVRKSRKPPGTHFRGAPMPYFVEFKPGYGLHAGHLPGYPASHGCVRLSYWKARQFYRAVRIGTPVTVTH